MLFIIFSECMTKVEKDAQPYRIHAIKGSNPRNPRHGDAQLEPSDVLMTKFSGVIGPHRASEPEVHLTFDPIVCSV